MASPAERSAQGVGDLVVVAPAHADVFAVISLQSPLSGYLSLLFYIKILELESK